MTAHYIYYDGAYRVYVHDGRGHRTEVGPRSGWPTPRSAADYADLLDQRSPSPLRVPSEAPEASRDESEVTLFGATKGVDSRSALRGAPDSDPLRGSGDESPDGLVLPQPPPVADSSPDSRERRRPARRDAGK